MGLGTSIFLVAVGAILDFAVHVTNNNSGININTIGLILMIVGAFGIVISLFFWNSWGGFGHRGAVARDRTIVHERDPLDSPRDPYGRY
jgi:hypothetical protein